MRETLVGEEDVSDNKTQGLSGTISAHLLCICFCVSMYLTTLEFSLLDLMEAMCRVGLGTLSCVPITVGHDPKQQQPSG